MLVGFYYSKAILKRNIKILVINSQANLLLYHTHFSSFNQIAKRSVIRGAREDIRANSPDNSNLELESACFTALAGLLGVCLILTIIERSWFARRPHRNLAQNAWQIKHRVRANHCTIKRGPLAWSSSHGVHHTISGSP